MVGMARRGKGAECTRSGQCAKSLHPLHTNTHAHTHISSISHSVLFTHIVRFIPDISVNALHVCLLALLAVCLSMLAPHHALLRAPPLLPLHRRPHPQVPHVRQCFHIPRKSLPRPQAQRPPGAHRLVPLRHPPVIPRDDFLHHPHLPLHNDLRLLPLLPPLSPPPRRPQNGRVVVPCGSQ